MLCMLTGSIINKIFLAEKQEIPSIGFLAVKKHLCLILWDFIDGVCLDELLS